jgi:hypothetical protein
MNKLLTFLLLGSLSAISYGQEDSAMSDVEIDERIKKHGRYALLVCSASSMGSDFDADPQIISETFIIDRKNKTYKYYSGNIQLLKQKKIKALLKNGDYIEGPLSNGVYTPSSKPEVINIIYDDFLNVEFEHELGMYKHHHRINGLNGTDILTLGYSEDFKSKLAPTEKDMKKRKNRFLFLSSQEKGQCFANNKNWKIKEMNEEYAEEIK